jgi:hypothetical protein
LASDDLVSELHGGPLRLLCENSLPPIEEAIAAAERGLPEDNGSVLAALRELL